MGVIDEVFYESRDETGFRYRSALGPLEISACASNVLRVRLDEGADGEAVRYAVGTPQGDFAAEIGEGDPATIETAGFTARVRSSPFGIDVSDRAGGLLVSGLTFAVPRRSLSAQPAGSGGAADGGETRGRDRRLRSTRPQVRMRMPGGDHFYGLGHGGRQFDRVGATRELWNSHVGQGSGSDIGVPLMLSNRGYGFLFDNTHEARVTVGRSDKETDIIFEAEGGPLDFYFLAAADTRSLLGVAADLLGHPTMPPLWSLGYLQSTRHFQDTTELRSLARTMRAKRIPCDGLIFLSTYSEVRGWNRQVGHLEFEPHLWPDAGLLIDEMRSEHFQLLLHEYPVLHPDSPLFREAADRGYLLEEGYRRETESPGKKADYRDGQRYLDFSNPDCRRWWWEHHRELVRLGVAGWWLDGGEGPSAAATLQAGRGEGLHNVYDLLRSRAFFEGEAESRPDSRPVLLCRSGAAGMQRYGAACWSGDIDNTFAVLAAQLPLGLNTALSGIPYWGTDIGGFFHPVEENPELFARWFQFGTFTPLFRSHGHVWREHLPWAHGPGVERICRMYADLRYALLPYTYSLAWQAHSRGLPLMRPLVLNYPTDPRVWDLADEYLWGDDLLVAPVTKEGARRWAVYLPEGSWYDYWTWEQHDGERGIEVDAPLDRLPLFVREGAVISLAGPIQHTGDGLPEELTLLCVPGSDSQFELYDDDGRTNAYQKGAYALTAMSCLSREGEIVLQVEPPRGDAASLPPQRRYLARILAPAPARVAGGDGSALPFLPPGRREGAGWWNDETFVYVRLPGLASRTVLSYTSEASRRSR